MPEVYSWMEGSLYVWTGTATASALVAFAQDSRVGISRGWLNRVSLGGTYFDHLTGQRADLSINALFTSDSTLTKIEASATAIHAHIRHSSVNGSAGLFLYSGRIDKLDYGGNENAPYKFTLAAHFNAFSAYGG